MFVTRRARTIIRPPGTGAGGGITASLVWEVEPSAQVHSGVVFYKSPVLNIADVNGRLLRQSGVPITVTITSGGGTLSGTTTVNTSASGRAEFLDLVITGTAGARTLEFTTSGVTAKQSTVTVFAIANTYTIADTGTASTNGTNLQAQINASAAAAESVVINLVAGATYSTGGTFIPKYSTGGPIVIQSNGSLPAYGTRLVPATHGAQLAKLKTTGNQTWVMGFQARAHDYIFRGIDFSMTAGGSQTSESVQLIQCGSFDPGTSQYLTTPERVVTIGHIFRHCFIHPPEATQAARNDTLYTSVNEGMNIETNVAVIDSDISGFAPKGNWSRSNDSPRRCWYSIASQGPIELYNNYLEATYSTFAFTGGGDTSPQNSGTITSSTLSGTTVTAVVSDVTNMEIGEYVSWSTGFGNQNNGNNTGEVTAISGSAGSYLVTMTLHDHHSNGGAHTPLTGATAKWRTSESAVTSGTVSSPTTSTMVLSNTTGIVNGTLILVYMNDGSGREMVCNVTNVAGTTITFTETMYGFQMCFVKPLVGGTLRWNGPLYPANIRICKCHGGNRQAWSVAGGDYPKGFFECKSLYNFLMDGCVGKCYTYDAGGGYYYGAPLALPNYNQNGGAPWTGIRNVQIAGCFLTGAKPPGTGGVIVYNGGDPYNVTEPGSCSNWLFHDILAEGDSERGLTVGPIMESGAMPDNCVIDHITMINGQSLVIASERGYGSADDFVFQNSIGRQGYGMQCYIGGNGSPTNADTHCYPVPGDQIKNLLINHAGDGLLNYGSGASGLIGVASWDAVKFVDKVGRNYQLASDSPGKSAATDGGDIGANLLNIYNAINPDDWPAGVTVPS